MDTESSKKSPVPALTRALGVLDALIEDPYELTLSELSERLHIPSASLWRIMKVLTDHEVVIFDKKRHTYRLGFKLMVMGNLLLSGSRFRSQGREYLKKLAELTGETAELDLRIRDQLVLIDQVAGPSPVTLYSHVGSAMPYFHATAPGKVYLAHVDREKRRQVMKKIGFPKLTDHTIQDMDRLELELQRFRKDGYAVDLEEMREDVGRVAAPVYDGEGRIMACLAIACPAFKLTDRSQQEAYGRQVKAVASEMSREGGRI